MFNLREIQKSHIKPNKKSLSGIINVINKIEDGKRITDQDVKGLQGV